MVLVQCKSQRCFEKPPSVKGGRVLLEAIIHGGRHWYVCTLVWNVCAVVFDLVTPVTCKHSARATLQQQSATASLLALARLSTELLFSMLGMVLVILLWCLAASTGGVPHSNEGWLLECMVGC